MFRIFWQVRIGEIGKNVTPHKIKASTMTAKVLSSCVSHSIP